MIAGRLTVITESDDVWVVSMKRLAAILSAAAVVLGLSVTPAAAAPDPATPTPPPVADSPAGPSVFVGDLTPAQLDAVVASGVDRTEVITDPGAAGKVRVQVILGSTAARNLVAAGVPLAVKEPTAQQRSTQRSAAGYEVFRSYSEPGGIRDEYIAAAKDHPDLVKLVVIGKTVQGQDIVSLKVTKNARKSRDGSRPAVLYSSAQHAREWITPEMNRRLLHYYLDHYKNDRRIHKIVDTTELWFVPVANPDGYDFTFTDGNRLWRKNLRDNNGDGVITDGDGVDANRNYPTKWGYDNEGSSPEPASETYRGPSPASEPETQALDGLMKRIKFEFLVNYHSAAELLLYGVGWQVATPTPDDLLYEAMAGDDQHPAIAGYDPDISAELYTTNGETTEHAQNAYGTLGFTPEMATCQTASEADPDDAFESEDCDSVFNFPDSEELVQAEFEKNVPFALAVAESAKDPSNPISVVGRTVPDFQVDSFDVSYGDPQTVAVTARRDIKGLTLHYRIGGGRVQTAVVREWRGGERYGETNDRYYAEFRGTVRGATPGQSVEVWFTGKKKLRAPSVGAAADRNGGKKVESSHFTYRLQQDGGSVLVLANEDYEGYNPGEPTGATAPKYAQQYVDALAASRVSSAVWDVTKQGVPHDLGVLSHFRAVVWYLGDNRLTQDAEDVETDTYLFGPLEDLSVAERQQYLTMSVRDYLNGGGKLALTGETTGYYGQLGSSLGGIYYGLNGAPDQDCVVTGDFFSDCLLLADDFTQYYLGAHSRTERSGPTTVSGTDRPFNGLTATLSGTPTNPIDEAGNFVATSDVLPIDQFPQFRSWRSSDFSGGPPPINEPLEGQWFVRGDHADDSYMRLARTIDLTATTAGQTPTLNAALGFDVEQGYDHVIVEAHTVGQDDWTTLPDLDGGTSTAVPSECEVGFLLEEHPFLLHYLTPGDPCTATGTSGAWNSFTGSSDGWQQVGFDLSAFAGRQVEVSISYVTDSASGGTGVFVDQAGLTIGGSASEPEGFETSLGDWAIPGSPEPDNPNDVDFRRGQSESNASASITTPDSVMLGYGIEQIGTAQERSAVLRSIVRYLGVRR